MSRGGLVRVTMCQQSFADMHKYLLSGQRSISQCTAPNCVRCALLQSFVLTTCVAPKYRLDCIAAAAGHRLSCRCTTWRQVGHSRTQFCHSRKCETFSTNGCFVVQEILLTVMLSGSSRCGLHCPIQDMYDSTSKQAFPGAST
eukprot:3328378-Amphidinium_carterae.1